MASSSRRSVISRSGSMVAGCRHGCRRPGPRSPSPLRRRVRSPCWYGAPGGCRVADGTSPRLLPASPRIDLIAGRCGLAGQLIGSDTVVPGRARVSTSDGEAWAMATQPPQPMRSPSFQPRPENGAHGCRRRASGSTPRTYRCTGLRISCVQWKIGRCTLHAQPGVGSSPTRCDRDLGCLRLHCSGNLQGCPNA